MVRTVIIGLALSAGIGWVHAANYQWEKDGVVHFSDRPPPGASDVREVQPPPPLAKDPASAREELRQLRQGLADSREDREIAQEKRAKEVAQVGRERIRCRAAKATLGRLLTRRNRRLLDAQGNVTALAEEERLKKMEEAHKAIAEWCS